MSQINSRQSYSLENPQGRSNPLTEYINNQPKKNKMRSKNIVNAYSLHVEHHALQKKRIAQETAAKKTEGWRDSLSILRTIPKPMEQELIRRAGAFSSSKKPATKGFNKSDGGFLSGDGYLKQGKVNGGGKNKKIIKIATAGEQTAKGGKSGSSELPTKSFKEIMDPYVSTEKRFEHYLKELDGDNQIDFAATKETGYVSSHSGEVTETDEYNYKHYARGGGDINTRVSTRSTTKAPSQIDRLSTLGVIDTVASVNGAASATTATTTTQNATSTHNATVTGGKKSPSHSKSRSRVGRVSSLGMDGRMSVTGSHFNNDNKDSVSRLSMNSTLYTNYDGHGYLYKDGEIQRKTYTMRENGADTSLSSQGVTKDVKLLEYLMKNSKVIPVYDKGKMQSKRSSKSVTLSGSGRKSAVNTNPDSKGDRENISDARGGGWKVLNGKSKRQPDFERMIPVSVVKLSCEIETQTENFG